tara:strand:- start:1426 stop:1563 length:138 start_codon:yes stop_codon:yes gene_type:complete
MVNKKVVKDGLKIEKEVLIVKNLEDFLKNNIVNMEEKRKQKEKIK